MIVAEFKVTVSILKKRFAFQFPVFHFRLCWISSTLSLALPGFSQTFWPCCSSSRWGGCWVSLLLKILSLGRGGDINNTTLTSQGIRDKLVFNPPNFTLGKQWVYLGLFAAHSKGLLTGAWATLQQPHWQIFTQHGRWLPQGCRNKILLP